MHILSESKIHAAPPFFGLCRQKNDPGADSDLPDGKFGREPEPPEPPEPQNASNFSHWNPLYVGITSLKGRKVKLSYGKQGTGDNYRFVQALVKMQRFEHDSFKEKPISRKTSPLEVENPQPVKYAGKSSHAVRQINNLTVCDVNELLTYLIKHIRFQVQNMEFRKK